MNPEVPQRPFSIRIFVPNGDPEGLRLVDRPNRSGIFVVFNRTNFKEAAIRPEFERTGVYVLIGSSDDSALPKLYIGEGDPVSTRLRDHYSRRDFWDWAVFFVTKDNSLNKAHVQQIESRLIEVARSAKQCKLENKNMPSEPTLSEADVADVDSFISDILSIFPLVGLSVFERAEPRSPGQEVLYIEAKGVKAIGYEDSKGFVVREGSELVVSETATIPHNASQLRRDLIEQGVVINGGELHRFGQDQVFSSPSLAAAVVLGRSSNGRVEWKNKDGTTLKELQTQESASIDDED